MAEVGTNDTKIKFRYGSGKHIETQAMTNTIPKTIHYCWFGHTKLPEIAERCIRSWQRHCSDYNITQWNESNFQVKDAPIYVQQAYEAGKWAFVSDYVRLSTLYKYGGIYMDTDLEVIKSMDAFLGNRVFISFENEKLIATAIMGSKPKNKWIETLLKDYEDRQFIKSDGSYDCTTNVTVVTNITVKHYGVELNNTYQELSDGVVIYPNDYFSPIDFGSGQINITEHTHAIHHFNASWFSAEEMSSHLRCRRLYSTIGMAFEAYEKHDWKTAYQKALLGLLQDHRLIFNRGVLSVILRSIWRDKLGIHRHR